MVNPCYSAGVNHIPDPLASPLELVAFTSPTAYVSAPSGLTGAVSDRSGLNSALLVVQSGDVSGAPDSMSVACKLQSSTASNGTFADIPGAAIVPLTDVGGFGEARVSVSLAGAKQFVRIVLAPTLVGGTAPTVILNALMVLSP